MHRAARVGLRVIGMREVEILDLVARAAAQLDRDIVMTIPHRRGFQRRLGDFLGALGGERCTRKSGKRTSAKKIGGVTMQHVVTPGHVRG